MKTLSPKDGSLIVDGSILSNWTQVAIARDEDGSTYTSSTDGIGTRTINANRAGKFTIDIPQTSESLALLTDLAESQDEFAVAFKDNSGFSEYDAATAYVVKHPDATFAKEVSDFQVVIQCEVLNMNSRGN